MKSTLSENCYLIFVKNITGARPPARRVAAANVPLRKNLRLPSSLHYAVTSHFVGRPLGTLFPVIFSNLEVVPGKVDFIK